MSHRPTIFYILENQTLGTWWVGKMESTLDGYGMPPYRSITQDQLNDKLYEKYHNPNAYLTLIPLKRFVVCYGVERWLSKLEYKINKEPEKYQELEELLKAGWDGEIETSTLSVLHVLEHNQPIDKIFKKLVSNREGLTRCLNTNKYKTYEDRKKDPDFLKAIGRKKVLRNMEKTKKLPKPETLAKYDIKDEEIKEVMGPRGIIYKITSPSGKAYVGQTIRSFEERIRNHQRKGSGCTAISRAIHKYGDEMKYEIIEDNIPHKQLDEREIYWIKELNSLAPSGYNLNTGGGQFYQITQEAKDRLRDTQQKLAIDKNGYLGTIHQNGNVFTPVINNNTTYRSLSNGGFKTKEEVIEVLKEYTKDPENFTIVEGTIQRQIGSVYKNSPNKWAASYKRARLGHYYTREEAQEALTRYIKDPENFVKPDKKVGSVFKRNDRWGVNYRGNYIASYDTQEEAREALTEYLKDPENFVKPRKKVGCIYKKYNKWVVICKTKRLGSYETEEEAQKVLKEYVETLQSS
jgi:group I intron endonuclease